VKATLHAFVAPAFDRVLQSRDNKAIRRRASISYVTNRSAAQLATHEARP
jgi:hypothetical protein